ncbi:hypothetical protein DESA109040_14975 [Deinococcus saxicola]|uniref:hypothetical protein n=1 Tax=Deinococcus saxicola TaxID=249406 RepID=UPI0039F03577
MDVTRLLGVLKAERAALQAERGALLERSQDSEHPDYGPAVTRAHHLNDAVYHLGAAIHQIECLAMFPDVAP